TPVTFNPPINALPPGISTVTASASDAGGAVASCSFRVQRPFLTINGFYPPLASTTPGSCTAPAVTNNAGSRVVVKFDLLLCNAPYLAATPIPTLTIRKVVPTILDPCAFGPPITGSFIQGVANQWHFNWNTLKSTDVGVWRIDVNLGDFGDPNPPYIWVRLVGN